MKKILFVAHAADICGGANRILLRMMEEMSACFGIQPSVLVPEAGEMQQACKAAGIPVYIGRYHSCCTVYRREHKDILRFLKLLFGPAVDALHTDALDKQLPRDFDLIYTNDRTVIAGAYLAKRRHIPHIWHARCFGWINSNRFPPLWYRRMERLSDRIITISGALRAEFAPHIQNSEKLLMIHDGIDLAKFAALPPTPHPRFRLLLSGRLIPAKGQTDAIRAMDILVNQHHADMELFLAGKAPLFQTDEYAQSLHSLVCRFHLEERVHFLGEVADITALRSGMDAELMCAWCEAFGLVSAEAMCAGLPVIGTNSGGTPEIIEDGVTGLLYPSGNPQELASQILRLYQNPQLAAQFGAAGRRRAQEYFSIKTCVQNIHRVICELDAL